MSNEHVAWCHYVKQHDRPTRIALCDSDAEGAFQVFREPLKSDWRIGIAVTPKMRTHYWYRHLGVVRRVHMAKDARSEMIDVEIYHADGETSIVHEPSDEWMTG
jgi:hypothetical protein